MPPTRLDEWYAKLHVPRNANEKDIRESFRRLVNKYHPDKVKEHDRAVAGQKLLDIKAAYAIIGNPAKRIGYEEHSAAMDLLNRAPSRMYGDFTRTEHKRSDVWLIPEFLLVPIGHADKFLRVDSDRSMVFHAREDAKTIGFEEFFVNARWLFNWRPDMYNPEGKPKFYGMCNLQSQPSPGADGRMLGSAGWLSFGLCPGAVSSDCMLAGAQNPGFCDLTLVPSPICSKAFRFESVYYPGHFLAFEPPTRAIMTNTINEFATIDFVLAALGISWQFQSLDEALIPSVVKLGGDKKHIKLTEVCKDPPVRHFFSMGMGGIAWDYDDFASYFLAHYDTWDYNAESSSVRVKDVALQAMAKRQQSKGQLEARETPPSHDSGEQAGKRSKPSEPNRSATKVLVLSNLVGAGDVDSDLEEETAEEAGKHGKLRKCVIKEISGVRDEEAVRIFLEFEAVVSAEKAREVFDGRLFAGRTVKAWFYDEELYKAGKLEEQDRGDETKNGEKKQRKDDEKKPKR